jgi:hypothetical protein
MYEHFTDGLRQWHGVISDITHLIITIANRVTNNVVRSAYCNNPPGGHNLCAKKITDAQGWTKQG